MADRYQDPWADAANQAVGGIFKAIMSRPNAAEMEAAALKNQLLQSNLETDNLQRQNIQSQMGARNYTLGQLKRESAFADQFANAFGAIAPANNSVVPTDPAQMGPVMPRSQADYNSDVANLFQQFAPRLSKDTVEASRSALGAANALRFDDPIQRQLAIDEKASSYENMMPGYTLAPGNVRFGADNQMIASAPFKTGGGSYIQQPDGTVISIDGGQPPGLTTSVTTDLQGKDISFDTYRSFTDSYRNSLINNPSAVGTRGNVARLADGLLGQVNSLAPGSEMSEQLKAIVNATAGQYTDPATGQIMNADLYDASTVASLLPFIAAEAIVGQGGRSLSNEDRELVQRAVGSPDDWLATPDKLLARMNQMDAIVENLRQKYQGRLTGQRPMTPAPESDALRMGGGGVVKWGVDDMGNPVPLGQ